MLFASNEKTVMTTTSGCSSDCDIQCESTRASIINGADVLFSRQFWSSQALMQDVDTNFKQYRLGETLIEEVAACLLGGYGIPAELGLSAFEHIRSSGILNRCPSCEEFEKILKEPLNVNGIIRNYRFPRQKAKYLADAVRFLNSSIRHPRDAKSFRNYLLEIPGIGYKTSSWITRNWLESDDIAIIDVHIYRACLVAGIFPSVKSIDKNYLSLERQFIQFAHSIPCRPSTLDNFMWNTMRRIGQFAKSSSHKH